MHHARIFLFAANAAAARALARDYDVGIFPDFVGSATVVMPDSWDEAYAELATAKGYHLPPIVYSWGTPLEATPWPTCSLGEVPESTVAALVRLPRRTEPAIPVGGAPPRVGSGQGGMGIASTLPPPPTFPSDGGDGVSRPRASTTIGPVIYAPERSSSMVVRATPYLAELQRLSAQRGLDWRLMAGVISVESGWNPNAESRVRARGLMQIMPIVAEEFSADHERMFEPYPNMDVGTRLWERLYRRFPNASFEELCGRYRTGSRGFERRGLNDGDRRYAARAERYARQFAAVRTLG